MDAFDFTPDTGGLVLVDKPLTWTSFDVVGKLRGAMRIAAGRKIKVGHAGTLDPLASGLLILAYGPFTKKLPLITGAEKTYTGTITLCSTTPSYDLETPTEPGGPWEQLDEATIRAAFAQFLGRTFSTSVVNRHAPVLSRLARPRNSAVCCRSSVPFARKARS